MLTFIQGILYNYPQCKNEKNKGLLEDCAAKKRKAGLKIVKRYFAFKNIKPAT